MNEQVMNAANAARAYCEASDALDAANELLKPYAEMQIEFTKRVATECNMQGHYGLRPYFYHDWIELSIGNFYQEMSDTPVINCELWIGGDAHGRDSQEGAFELSQHILNGDPEKFVAELRRKLESESQKRAREEQEITERKIAQLQLEIHRLRGDVK